MLHLIFGRSGFGKTFYAKQLLSSFTSKEKIFFLVPEQASFDSEKEMLHALGPIESARVQVVSFSKLVNLFFDSCGEKQNATIDETGKAALMKLTLRQLGNKLELYQRQSASPQFAAQLTELSTQLKRAAATPDDLLRAAGHSQGILKKKADEISAILTAYNEKINERYKDPDDMLTKMAAALPSNRFFEGATVVLDEFRGFTVQQLQVLDKMLAQAEDVYVTLGCDNLKEDSGISLFSNVIKTANTLQTMARDNGVKIAPAVYLTENRRAQNDEIRHLEQNLFAQDMTAQTAPCEQIHLYRAANLYDEAEYVARTIKQIVRTRGLRFRDFAVIARDSSAYSGIIDSIFEQHEIPYFMDRRNEIADMAIFRYVIAALDFVADGMQPADLLMLLKSPISMLSVEEVSLLDDYIMLWDIHSADLRREFTYHPRGFQESFTDEDKETLSQIEALRIKAMQPLLALADGVRAGSAKNISRSIYEFLMHTKAVEKLREYVSSLEADGQVRQASEQRRCYDLLIDVLDRLVAVFSYNDTSLSDFYDLFITACSLSSIGSVPSGLDEVTVGNAGRMRPGKPKVTFIIGANEGVFPAPLPSGGLLTDYDVKTLRQHGISLPDRGEEQAIDERYLAYSAMCSPSQQLFVSYQTSSMRGEAMQPSELVEQIKLIFPKCIETVSAEQIESVAALTDAYVRAESAGDKSSATYGELLRQISPDKYDKLKNSTTAMKDSLQPQTAEALYGRDLYFSPSRVDAFYKCPFQYFCNYGLKVKTLRPAKLDSLERGTLVHDVLENAIADYATMVSFSREQLHDYCKGHVDEYLKLRLGDKEPTASEAFSYERLCDMLTELVAVVLDGFKHSDFRPFKTELSIGERGDAVPPMTYQLPDGTTLKLRGKVDRVDTFIKDGKTYIRVVDYKTGKKEFSLEDVQYGQNLQMLVYLMMLQKGGEKLFGSEPIPAGVLYMPSREADAYEAREVSGQDIENNARKSLRMNGILFDQGEAVMNAMEHGAANMFVPFAYKKDGDYNAHSSVATSEAYGVIMRHIDGLLCDMGMQLHCGNIEVSPRIGHGEDACKYCDFRSVCGRDPSEKNEQIKTNSKFKKSRIDSVISQMKEVQDNGI